MSEKLKLFKLVNPKPVCLPRLLHGNQRRLFLLCPQHTFFLSTTKPPRVALFEMACLLLSHSKLHAIKKKATVALEGVVRDCLC